MKRFLSLAAIPAVLSALILSACTGGKKEISEGFYAMELPTGNKEANINMSRVAESISYIPLETTDTCHIENIWKIVPMNDHLVIMDKKTVEHVWLFTKSGKFVREISSKGLADGQYATLGDIAADPATNRIFILDGSRKTILAFDTADSLLSKTPTLFYVENFAYLGDDTFALNPNYNNSKYFNGDTPNLILMNLRDGVTGRYVMRPKALDPSYMIGFRSNFSTTAQGATYTTPLCDTIFLASATGARPLYLADFGNDNELLNQKYIADALVKKPAIYSLDKFYEEMDKVFLTGFYAFDQVAIATYNKGIRKYASFYYPETGKVLSSCTTAPQIIFPVANDMDGITVFNPLGGQGNEMYCYTTLGLAPIDDASLSPEAKKVKDAFREGDNPVLALVKLK